MIPLVTWDRIDDSIADRALIDWEHWLGENDRPFGSQSFGLYVGADLVAVAVSASTCGTTCAKIPRRECVELARLCAHPANRDLTRVALRLWRKTAAREWAAKYWTPRAYVSYSNRRRHNGDVYRFDGWTKWGNARAGRGGGTRKGQKTYEAKTIWVYHLNRPKAQHPSGSLAS